MLPGLFLELLSITLFFGTPKHFTMSETLEYIDAYFQKALNEKERAEFEARCGKDEIFAQEVAFYLTSRQVLREELLQQKRSQWKKEVPVEEGLLSIAPARKVFFARWLTYAVAASLVLAIAVYFFERTTSPHQLAESYILKNLTILSHTMDGSSDSLQQGMDVYNNKDYKKALPFFEGVYNRDSSNSDAKAYIGIVYLQIKEYDKALQQFDELANMKGLYSNKGMFYKAITLMERDKPGDRQEAKKLLEKIISENADGRREAAEWLKKF
jgi:tetratricopeptide (TPR) repeat protein